MWGCLAILWPGISPATWEKNIETFVIFGCVASVITSLSLHGLGVYRTALAQASTDLAFKVAISTFSSVVILYIASIYFTGYLSIRDFFVYWVLVYSCLNSGRFAARVVLNKLGERGRELVAIYGAGVAGKLLLKALKHSDRYKVVLLIDDSEALRGEIISSLQVHNFTQAKKHLKRLNIETVLLALPSVENKIRQSISARIASLSIKTKAIPNFYELIVGGSGIDELSEISTSDLLGREVMKAHTELIEARIKNKVVLVTGAGGSIGSELCRQILTFGPSRLIALDVSEAALFKIIAEIDGRCDNNGSAVTPVVGSVLDVGLIASIFKEFNINTVYHSAAYKHVPLMEQNVIQVFKNNVLGTAILTKYSKKFRVESFTLISTDKAVNPTNVMGASKRLAELLCLTSGDAETPTLFNVVRFGNVLGSSGSAVPIFIEQIKNGGPVTVTDSEMTRFFMSISEASLLVLQASGLAKDGNIFVLNMGDSIRILDLAKKLIRLFGKVPVDFGSKVKDNEVEIKFTGIRSGEKLYEELTFSLGDLKNTIHPMIFNASEPPLLYEETNRKLMQLSSLISKSDYGGLFKFLSEDFPGVSDITQSADIFLKERSLR